MAEAAGAREDVPARVSPRVLRALRIAFVGYLLLVLRITQWPQPDPSAFGWLEDLLAWGHGHGLPGAVDMVVAEATANVVMFVPFGLLLPLATRLPPWTAVPLGAAFSTAIELSQLALFPSRFATVQDVVMNTLGAALGWALLRFALQGRTGPAGLQHASTRLPP